MPDSPPHPRAAYIEEFNEEQQTAIPESRQTASTANITVKRSKPDGLKPKNIRDEFSDSGYSSHTAATLGSGDSSLESKAESNPLNLVTNIIERQRRPYGFDKKTPSRSQNIDIPLLRRTDSKARKDGDARPKRCQCEECLSRPHRSAAIHDPGPYRLPNAQPRNQASAPVSPQSPRKPFAQLIPDAPIPQLSQARPRASSQSVQRPRPMSFHAGIMPEAMNTQQPLYIERRPAARYPTASPFPPPSYPPPQTYCPPLQPLPSPQDLYVPVPSSYEPQLPLQPRHWNGGHQPSARPQSMFYDTSPAIIEYAQPIHATIVPSARPLERQGSRRERRSTLREEYSGPDVDQVRMPPPRPPPRIESQSHPEQRPTIRHAKTTSAALPVMQHRSGREDITEGHASHRSSRKQSFDNPQRSRRPSLPRATRTSDTKVASADSVERDLAHMRIESGASSKSRRRVSVYGHESLKDLEGSVEAYQASKGNIPNHRSMSIGDDTLRLVRKKTHTNSSDAESRVSTGTKASREGSDLKPRSSTDRRSSSDIKKRDDDGGFAMRIPKGVNVDLNPGMEGRSISLRQSRDGDGDMELSIGSRGRTVGTRPAGREKSTKRYSIIEGNVVKELEPARGQSQSRVPRDHGNGDDRKIVRERIITTSRSRRSSRSGYSGRGQADHF